MLFYRINYWQMSIYQVYYWQMSTHVYLIIILTNQALNGNLIVIVRDIFPHKFFLAETFPN